jgi:hypothetical protein
MTSVSSSKRAYSIVEPHPSVPATSYYITGRGGAGNKVKAPSTVTRGSDASGPAAKISLSSFSIPRKTFTTGRGGAGNVHPSSERAIFSFDEELEYQLSQERHAAPVYHVGRGGAGNISSSDSERRSSQISRRTSDDRASMSSTSSSESGADYLNRNLKKGFKKMMAGHV